MREIMGAKTTGPRGPPCVEGSPPSPRKDLAPSTTPSSRKRSSRRGSEEMVGSTCLDQAPDVDQRRTVVSSPRRMPQSVSVLGELPVTAPSGPQSAVSSSSQSPPPSVPDRDSVFTTSRGETVESRRAEYRQGVGSTYSALDLSLSLGGPR